MSNLPPRPNFKQESEEYFLVCVQRAIEAQYPVVEMSRWRLPDLINPENDLINAWRSKGWVDFVEHDDSWGHTHKTVTVHAAGFAAAKRIERRRSRAAFFDKLKGESLSLFNAVSAFVAAVAAVAAAYFSYLSLNS